MAVTLAGFPRDLPEKECDNGHWYLPGRGCRICQRKRRRERRAYRARQPLTTDELATIERMKGLYRLTDIARLLHRSASSIQHLVPKLGQKQPRFREGGKDSTKCKCGTRYNYDTDGQGYTYGLCPSCGAMEAA